MKLKCSKNRYLEPVNFGKEMYLQFNLPPIHVLSDKFVPELAKLLVEKRKSRFFRKFETQRPSWVKRLVSADLSASLNRFRINEEEKMRLPMKNLEVNC